MQYVLALARHKLIVLATVLLVAGGLFVIMAWPGRPAGDASPAELPALATDGGDIAPDQPPEATPDALVVVYVSGAVREPDVYQLPKAARIKDLVFAAGGFSAEADTDQINLAERIADGQHIHVPRQGDAAPASRDGTAGTAGEQQIDINAASAADLDSLPGIGQALAQRIVDYRTSNGPFKSVEDLKNVKGIGPALFEKIAPLITAGS